MQRIRIKEFQRANKHIKVVPSTLITEEMLILKKGTKFIYTVSRDFVMRQFSSCKDMHVSLYIKWPFKTFLFIDPVRVLF